MAVVGCGKIADQHVEHIVHIPHAQIVGVCDHEPLMAKQLQERLNVSLYSTDIQDLLERARPDVVHITTPPHSHHMLGKLCLEAGCHVYVEKPFTVTLTEAKDLIVTAERMNRKLTVGHNAQFSHAATRMRTLVAQGYLGGPPVHLESYYCYDLRDAGYAKALLADHNHWVRRLPGALLQNTISHGISKLAEFLTDDHLQVVVHGFTSTLLESIGEDDIIDELRAIIRDGMTTAYFTFSSQMRPSLHQLRIYGPRNGLIVNEHQQTVLQLRGSPYKSYLEQIVPSCGYAAQYLANAAYNIKQLVRADFHAGYGMRSLIRAFYRSIEESLPPPIPHREILLTSRIMDEIFAQLRPSPRAKC
ncbi:MAG: Gfo/Idh/MocA family oxidoreductase [Bryobacterales bacterium]|nr:Gfo/Idh/MocA family oxidoreductase [Bryobacterales bacterium]